MNKTKEELIAELKGLQQDYNDLKVINEKNEVRFESLSRIASEGLMIHDNGIILDANLAFAKMIGFEKPEEIIGKDAYKISPLTRKILGK